jgi:hypothetical protein
LQPDIPVENIIYMYECARDWNEILDNDKRDLCFFAFFIANPHCLCF